MALTTTWMLKTGRRLHRRPVVHDLSPSQLIAFWCDDNVGDTLSDDSCDDPCDGDGPTGPPQSALDAASARQAGHL